ncbi:MAG: hypothetical protein QM737_18790 [Ferruginibacter sp.]
MSKIILIPIFCLIISPCSGQIVNDKITASVEIVGKGNPIHCTLPDSNWYFAKFAVRNNTDSTIKLFISDPFWYNNWITENDSIFITPFAGDGGMFVPFDLSSKKSQIFYGVIRPKLGTISNQLRIGFVDFRRSAIISSGFRESQLKQKIYWSNKIKLESKIVMKKDEVIKFENQMPFWPTN